MNKHCKPCEEGAEKLSGEEIARLHAEVPEWEVKGDKALVRSFPFKDFAKALAFANEVGRLAEENWHHPDIHLSWGHVEVSFSTHSLNGLSENDFIMAHKVDEYIDGGRAAEAVL